MDSVEYEAFNKGLEEGWKGEPANPSYYCHESLRVRYRAGYNEGKKKRDEWTDPKGLEI